MPRILLYVERIFWIGRSGRQKEFKVLATERDDYRLAAFSRLNLMMRVDWCGGRVGQVGEDGRVSQFMKVKLSVSASSVRETGLREVRSVQPNYRSVPTVSLSFTELTPGLTAYASPQ